MPDEVDLSKLGVPIPIDQVEFRVQSISANGWALLLAYKDARVDMDRLDAVLGVGNWQRKHKRIGNELFCRVGIHNKSLDPPEWVWMEDVGVPSNQEAVKGEASDAFKRACFNLGIGRELYDYPLLLVELNEEEFYVKDGKAKATYNLKLKDWLWHSKRSAPDDNGKTVIDELKACDEKGNERFEYPRGKQPARSDQPQQSTQSQQSSTGKSKTDGKPWYNTFDDDEAVHLDLPGSGSILTSLARCIAIQINTSSK